MYGMPSDFGPSGFDPSLLLLAGYLLSGMAAIILILLVVGIATLPVFFVLVFVAEAALARLAEFTGVLVVKVLLILFRGLRRSPLRTSLTYLALFVLTGVLTGV
ncbi:MAG TPA: hypothetical protein VKE74_10725, partial [Gemmataceae bacterium]|nr:hypothetical protein [Gemmataceae bacterium]